MIFLYKQGCSEDSLITDLATSLTKSAEFGFKDVLAKNIAITTATGEELNRSTIIRNIQGKTVDNPLIAFVDNYIPCKVYQLSEVTYLHAK